MTRIAYLPGDGIGPEVLAVARRVLTAAGFEAEWVDLPVGWSQWVRHGDALPATTIEAMRSTDAAFFGAITSKPEDEAQRELSPALRAIGVRYESPIVRLRRHFDLGVNVRPVRSLPGNPANLRDDVDLVIFRENTEDVYAGLESRPFPEAVRDAWIASGARNVPAAGDDTAVTARVITRRATERLVEAAFKYAVANRRRKVTLVEKANVMRATGGLVREVFQEVARRYPAIATEELNVDAACARLVRRPDDFDVIVATNLFGDILSDVAAEVAGGLPLAASANIGGGFALFEPVHGSAPDIAGRGLANPMGAILSGAMLARHVGQASVADRVERAIHRVVIDANARGTMASTSAIEALVLASLHSLLVGATLPR